MISSDREARALHGLARIGLSPPERLELLRRPSAAESKCSLPGDDHQARELLIQQRTTSPGYRPPETKLRNRLSTRRRKHECNRDEWVFTDHEVATALNSLLQMGGLGPAGLLETVLLHSNASSLAELWKTFHSGKRSYLVKRKRSQEVMLRELPWLNTAAEHDSVDHVRTMCQSVVSTQAIGKAFEISVSKYCLATMKVLLSYGADPNECITTIRGYLRRNDLTLTKLLLSAPKGLIAESWRFCLEPYPGMAVESLALVLAHRPDVVSEQILQTAIRLQCLAAATVLLAYARPEDVARYDHVSICHQICGFSDIHLKSAFIALLSEADCLVDCADTREELLNAVKLRWLPLISVLIRSCVSLDGEPHNVLVWVAKHPDAEVFELLKFGTLSSQGTASDAFCLVPRSIPETTLLQALDMFTHLSAGTLPKRELGIRLVDACEKGYNSAVTTLLSLGAEPSFDEAAAMHATIKKGNIDLLHGLLHYPCSPTYLSELAKTTLTLPSRSIRQRVFETLVTKDLDPIVLSASLETIVGETGEPDHQLVELLILHKASPDLSDSWKVNSVLTATRKGEFGILKLLCSAGPSVQTLARAVCVAYSVREVSGASTTKLTMELLLTNGASGSPVNDTLRAAVYESADLDIVRLLIRHGADANCKDGECLVFASMGGHHELLQALCSGSTLTATSALRALLLTIDAKHYDRTSLGIIMESTDHAVLQQICDVLWASDPFVRSLRDHPNASEIVSAFLQHDLNIKLTNDELLVLAVQMKDLSLARALLLTERNRISLSSAFASAFQVSEKALRITYMRMLLEAAQSTEIGQSGALASETQMAIKDSNCEGISLLLEHKASVDYDDGEAVRGAAVCGTGSVLSMLLGAEPSLATLKRASVAAAGSRLLSDMQKRKTCESILEACDGVLAPHSAQLLHESIAKAPRAVTLPLLLLERGVEINGSALGVALMKASRQLLGVILEHCDASVALAHSRSLPLSFARQALIYSMVLNKPDHGVPSIYLSHMLLQTLCTEEIRDLTVVKLLLRQGADVGYIKAEPLRKAIESESLTAVKLLSQHINTIATGDLALSHLARASLKDSEARRGMFKCLLKRRVTKKACSSALRIVLEKKNKPDKSIVSQLLAKGAEPSLAMFVKSARWKSSELFAELCSGLAKSSKAIEGLLGYCDGSQEATVKTDAISCCVSPEVGAEPCTLFIWALLARPKIPTDAIMVMLGKKPHVGRIDYMTPNTHVSAAFACLLDVTRLPILRALLATNKDALTNQMISSQTMTHFAIHTEGQTVESADLGSQPLHMAAFYLGNFEAFELLCHRIPLPLGSDEGLLHLAAFLALPKFVRHLLSTHDPNECLEEYGSYIPLAVALVTTTAGPWGIVANEETAFAARRKETIDILASKSNLAWRDRGKTVLHFALHQGLETTGILLNALLPEFALDSNLRKKFLYTDKEDRIYTPEEYVRDFLKDINEEDKRKLIHRLEQAGVASS